MPRLTGTGKISKDIFGLVLSFQVTNQLHFYIVPKYCHHCIAPTLSVSHCRSVFLSLSLSVCVNAFAFMAMSIHIHTPSLVDLWAPRDPLVSTFQGVGLQVWAILLNFLTWLLRVKLDRLSPLMAQNFSRMEELSDDYWILPKLRAWTGSWEQKGMTPVPLPQLCPLQFPLLTFNNG